MRKIPTEKQQAAWQRQRLAAALKKKTNLDCVYLLSETKKDLLPAFHNIAAIYQLMTAIYRVDADDIAQIERASDIAPTHELSLIGAGIKKAYAIRVYLLGDFDVIWDTIQKAIEPFNLIQFWTQADTVDAQVLKQFKQLERYPFKDGIRKQNNPKPIDETKGNKVWGAKGKVTTVRQQRMAVIKAAAKKAAAKNEKLR